MFSSVGRRGFNCRRKSSKPRHSWRNKFRPPQRPLERARKGVDDKRPAQAAGLFLVRLLYECCNQKPSISLSAGSQAEPVSPSIVAIECRDLDDSSEAAVSSDMNDHMDGKCDCLAYAPMRKSDVR